MIDLYPVKEFRFPVIAECISPDRFQAINFGKIGKLKVYEGNRQKNLSELFKIKEAKTEDPADGTVITIHGDLRKVRKIGARMTSGMIIINGDVGMHLGEEMKGGRIAVHGNAGGWAGSSMRGGTIEIQGNAGDYLGAPYRGSNAGIRGGRIVVHGNVGVEAGAHMSGGTVKICGDVGQFVGFRMRGGTIYVRGDSEGRAGACMTDGRIVIAGLLESLLPTFTTESVKAKVKIEDGGTVEGPFYAFLGDLSENGDGKLYVSKEKNPHLSYCERFL
jgi:formylmethanofuran dehydrogenase subunit C